MSYEHFDPNDEYGCGGIDEHCDAIQPEPECDSEEDDHEWTSEGMGGCDENPGVWSLGGTTIRINMRCIHCEMVRSETFYGSQRNPYECDSVRYLYPD